MTEEISRFVALHTDTLVLDAWVVNSVYTMIGVGINAFVLLPTFVLIFTPMKFEPIHVVFLIAALTISLSGCSWATRYYRSFFSYAPLVKNNNLISFCNGLFGGALFGIMLNNALSKAASNKLHSLNSWAFEADEKRWYKRAVFAVGMSNASFAAVETCLLITAYFSSYYIW